MSALIIAAHVKEGVEMARKARLPEPIVTAIREHHGTKLIRYFYQKAVSKAEPGEEVAEVEYRYPGPRPSTRILGILMIADAVEAASRTLVDPTPAKIRAMIRQIVDDCLRDGQFDECDLTMRDLSIIVETLERTVTTVFHHRIDYPGFDFNRERTTRRPRAPPSRPRGAGDAVARGRRVGALLRRRPDARPEPAVPRQGSPDGRPGVSGGRRRPRVPRRHRDLGSLRRPRGASAGRAGGARGRPAARPRIPAPDGLRPRERRR